MRLASPLSHVPLLVLALATVFAATATAAVPSPTTSTHDPCFVICPLGDIAYHVTVRDVAGNPVANSTVVLDFSQCGFVHCPTQPPGIVVNDPAHTMSTLSNALGVATLPLAMGGCCPGVKIFADGVLLATVSMSSPDQDASLLVNGADNAILTTLLGTTNPCGDLDCSGTVDAADVAILVAHNGHSCNGITPTRPRSWGSVKTIYR